MGPSPEKLLELVIALRPDWQANEVSGFLYLEGGYSNDNYRFEYHGERYVLRAPFRPRTFVDRHAEQRIYAQANDSQAVGIVGPPVVAFDRASGAMITRWVAGRLLADSQPAPTELLAYLRRLHEHMPAVERIYDPLEQARAHLACAAPPAWLEDLANALDWAPEHLATCHNDLNPWNVICSPQGLWVTLDWEWAGRNDPLFDLVALHQGSGLADAYLPDLAKGFLERPADSGRLHRCLTVYWLRETSWAMAEIAAGHERPEVVEQRELGLKRLAALQAASGA